MRHAISLPNTAVFSLLAMALSGCGPSVDVSSTSPAGGGGAGGSGGSGGAGGGAPDPIVWSPCPLHLGGPDLDAECAEVLLPARWDQPDGATIPVFVQRLLGKGPVHTQLWWLQGGPGAASNTWASYMELVASADPGIDSYTLDHRGTGRSARLGCPAQESEASAQGQTITEEEWPDCIAAVQAQWGDDLLGFSSEGAARDVAALVDRTREDGKRVVLYGASYGTTWAHRFLQLFPDEVDGVVLDSSNWPDRTLEDYDVVFEQVAKSFFDACGQDTFCKSKLGDDPWATLVALYGKLSAGHCPELAGLGFSKELLRKTIAWMLAYDLTRADALALVYRVDRCTPEDQTAAMHAYTTLLGEGGLFALDDPLFSWVLNKHIVYSEIALEPTSAAAQAFADTCTVCLGGGGGPMPPYAETWPRYPFSDTLKTWAETATPLLGENGGMDPFAPAFRLEQAGFSAHFSKPGQHPLVFPTAPHGVVWDSPTAPQGALSCGLQIMLDFMQDPKADLASSCLSKLAPLEFTGQYADVVFGTMDAWE